MCIFQRGSLKTGRFLRHLSCILLFLLAFFCLCSPGYAEESEHDFRTDAIITSEIEHFFDFAVPAGLARYNIPGATVSFVQDGEMIFARGYGYSDIENKTPVIPEKTLFPIGSITKLFTWTAVMQLVEEEKIDLDIDINTYLTDFSLPATYPKNPITMRDLMTHSAGFEEQEKHMAVRAVDDLYSFRTYCRESIPARVYPPGTITSYSNYGTTLAAVVIEDITGIPYDRYLHEQILVPLAMNRTWYSYTLPPDTAKNLSSGFHYEGGKNVPVPDSVYVIGPAGIISSTATDMAHFLSAHMENGTFHNTAILSENTTKLMHAPAFSNDPRVSSMCLGFYEMYLNGERILTHGGDTDTFHSLLVLLPDRKTGFFVSYNSPGGNEARNELVTEFMDTFYQAENTMPETIPDTISHQSKYAGAYQSTRHNYQAFEYYLMPPQQVRIEDGGEGRLVIKREGKPSSTYTEISPGIFTQSSDKPEYTGNMIFREDETGTVNFLCIENVPIFAFERVPWYGTILFTDWMKNIGIIILLTMFIWPVSALFRRVYGISDTEEKPAATYARLMAGAAAILFLFFVLFLLPAVTGDVSLIKRYMEEQAVPLIIQLVMTLPVIAVVLTVIASVFMILIWKENCWTIWSRLHYTLIVLGLYMMTWWVNFWNLFVFRL
ncbi:MAG: beta-lactamase family protein [Methanospirillaceae archaeon]|nr:beta-lactamase family protein [Methanospirillaceae archaeon]